MSLDNRDNIMLQGLYNAKLMMTLINEEFVKSNYFKELNFDSQLKEIFEKQIGLGNRGMMLTLLYSLLVVPKELFIKDSNESEQLTKVNCWLEKKVLSKTNSNYKKDEKGIDYIRHIRNSAAHAKVNFQGNEVVFQDDDKSANCEIYISLENVGLLIMELEIVLTEYNNKKR